MEKLSKLKLTKLSKDELETKRMNAIRGGGYCVCAGTACMGGIEVMDNSNQGYANADHNMHRT